jgi:hypothetical protein
MGVELQIDVVSLDASHRRALEEVIGCELAANQRVTISISDDAAPSSAPKPAQSLQDWTAVYEGLSDDDVDEIDRIVKTRANLTRPLP